MHQLEVGPLVAHRVALEVELRKLVVQVLAQLLLSNEGVNQAVAQISVELQVVRVAAVHLLQVGL